MTWLKPISSTWIKTAKLSISLSQGMSEIFLCDKPSGTINMCGLLTLCELLSKSIRYSWSRIVYKYETEYLKKCRFLTKTSVKKINTRPLYLLTALNSSHFACTLTHINTILSVRHQLFFCRHVCLWVLFSKLVVFVVHIFTFLVP